MSLTETLVETGSSLVARAYDPARRCSVIVKLARAHPTDPACEMALSREYELLRLVDGQHVARPLDMQKVTGSPALVLEDIGGGTLVGAVQPGPLPWRTAVTLAIAIADALQDIHAGGVVHRSINPASVLWNAATGELRVYDFCTALRPPAGTLFFADPERLVGAPAYLSPEQTGRVGIPLDSRSDIYSLGVTLFELVTGRLPFAADDPLELVHAHIARPAPDAAQVCPEVPPVVAAIIHKMMEKQPRDRYQSAFGLRADLEAVQALAHDGAPPPDLELGRHDVPGQLTISATLQGRDTELAALEAVRLRVHSGTSNVVLISGPSGSGKSSLVRTFQESAARAGDRVAAGKFDPATDSVPHHAIGMALQALVRQVIGQGDSAIDALRARLFPRLRANGAVAIELVPDLVHVLGPQTEIPHVRPQDVRARTLLVQRELIAAFAETGKALIIFLDDLQWADASSLDIMFALAGDRRLHNLLIVGAYRNGEVGPAHPLRRSIAAFGKSPDCLTQFELPPLSLDEIASFLADSLHQDTDAVADLAEACAAKTLGNPFFLTQFLRTLYRRHCLGFDQRRGRWTWSRERIAEMAAAENVIDLMVARFHDLPDATRSLLKIAACIGTAFDLRTLAIVSGRTLADAAGALTDAIAAGLVRQVGDEADAARRPSAEDADAGYRFSHDRVREAAAALLDTAEEEATHLGIGRALLTRLSDRQVKDRTFQIVRHFNWGQALITAPAERQAVARLALDASCKAGDAGGFAAAFHHASFGLSLLPEDAWERDYELTLALHDETIVNAYLNHCHQAIDGWVAAVRANSRQLVDQTRAVEIQILRANARGALHESVAIGREFLARLGVSLPDTPSDHDVAAGLAQVQTLLAGRDINRLVDLPEMTDATALSVMQICNALAGPTYNSSPQLFMCMVFRQVEWFLTYGNGADAAVAYSAYAMALCVVARNYEEGYAFGRVALDLADRFNVDHLKAQIYLNVYLFVHHWRHHLAESLPYFTEGQRMGQNHGNLFFAAVHAHVYCHHKLFTAPTLTEIDAAMEDRHRAIVSGGQDHVALWTRIFWQFVRNLQGPREDPTALVGPLFDERENLDTIQDSSDKTLIFVYHFIKLMICVMFGDRPGIVRHLVPAEQFLFAVVGIVHVPVCHFFAFLGRLELLRGPDGVAPDERQAMLQAMRTSTAQMAEWAANAPMNYAHKHAAMAAGLADLEGDGDEAVRLYESAIALAQTHGHAWDRAICLELAGRHFLAKGLDRVAGIYLADASAGYAAWGAHAKVAALAETHGGLLAGAPPSGPHAAPQRVEADRRSLDLKTVLKASQAISAEIVLDRFLDRTMHTVLENAGADRGLLLRVDSAGDIHLWAETRFGENASIASPAADTDPSDRLPLSLVNYVATTLHTVIHTSELPDPPFVDDPYLVDHGVLSALCMPLRSRNRLVALLYLENTLTSGAFTARHLEILEMLASQIAVSLENASLYEDLENRVAERTQKLQEKMAELSQAYDSVRRARTRLEEQTAELRLAKAVAEQANQSKSEFLASASHELRTPLNAILGFAEILRDGGLGPLDAATISDYAGSIHQGGSHLLAVIDDLLDLAKIEAGRMALELEPLDVGFEIQNCLRLVAQRASNHGLSITCELAPALPRLTADRRAIRQILFNLLSNAIKFTPDGGSIVLSAGKGNAATMVITVADTGMGIAQEEIGRVFEPFRRTRASERQGIQGTGLGLPLVKAMVEEHGGHITLASTPGEGTVVTLTLPLTPADKASVSDPSRMQAAAPAV
ncbi:MAG: AAA family ATPase [Rhodospirillaceae bacterium]|nr:AAA family ATPase [Rhodospirillaceae bacterium]